MTTSTLTREDLTRVAPKASLGLLRLTKGDLFQIEDVNHGLELLELLERAHAATKKDLEVRTQEEEDDHRAVRRCFFLDRVPGYAPGWQEWNTAIDREFKVILDTLMESKNLSEVKRITASILKHVESFGPVRSDQIDRIHEIREIFAELALLLNNPR